MIQDVKLGTHRIGMYMYAISKCTFLLGFRLDLVLEALCIFLANLSVHFSCASCKLARFRILHCLQNSGSSISFKTGPLPTRKAENLKQKTPSRKFSL